MRRAASRCAASTWALGEGRCPVLEASVAAGSAQPGVQGGRDSGMGIGETALDARAERGTCVHRLT